MSNDYIAQSRKHPVLELVTHYWAVFKAAWASRVEISGQEHLPQEIEFLPAAMNLQETPPHPAPRWLAYAIISLFVIAIVWATFGKIDIVAVAPGRIIVTERTKQIQPLENGVVRRVLVKDGDHVVAGQNLVLLDPTLASADKANVDMQLKSAQSEELRTQGLLRALQTNDPRQISSQTWPKDWSAADAESAQAQLEAEWTDVQAKLTKFGAELARRRAEMETVRAMAEKLEATLPLSRAREEDFKRLSEQGFMSPHAGQDRTRDRIELERDLATQRARLHESEAALKENENARLAYLAETRRQLHERRSKSDLARLQTTQDQSKAAQREMLTTLVAPVAGTVQQLAIHTEGGVVTEAQVLMVIVPDGGQVMAEVTLENKDIGFVTSNQEAEIKFETFSFTRYGTVPARVTVVTQDAVLDEKRGAIFPITLELKHREIDVDGKKVRLSPGMNLTAEIKTGQRRVIEYLLSPIQRAGSESLRER